MGPAEALRAVFLKTLDAKTYFSLPLRNKFSVFSNLFLLAYEILNSHKHTFSLVPVGDQQLSFVYDSVVFT